jgi:hypothetical protein
MCPGANHEDYAREQERLHRRAEQGASTTQALAAADAAAAAAIDAVTSDASSILMAGYLNFGRNVVFNLNSDDLHALQRSELLDPSTCNYCLSIDGRIVETSDPFAQNTIFPTAAAYGLRSRTTRTSCPRSAASPNRCATGSATWSTT